MAVHAFRKQLVHAKMCALQTQRFATVKVLASLMYISVYAKRNLFVVAMEIMDAIALGYTVVAIH